MVNTGSNKKPSCCWETMQCGHASWNLLHNYAWHNENRSHVSQAVYFKVHSHHCTWSELIWDSSEHVEGYELTAQFVYITVLRTGVKVNCHHKHYRCNRLQSACIDPPALHCRSQRPWRTNTNLRQCYGRASEPEIVHWQKFADFTLPHLHLAAPLAVTPFEFEEIFGIRKLESLGYPVTLFAWS